MTETTAGQDTTQHDNDRIGPSQKFVISRGFNDGILIGADGTARLFLELTADVDRTEVRPQAAWNAVLSSMPPGWTMRVLQAIWPDPHPRAQFRAAMEEQWPNPKHDGKQLLYDELLLSLEEIPLPLMRRTIVELAVPLDALEDAFSFVDGTVANLAGYGVQADLLSEDGVRNLVHGIFNPEVKV